MIRDSKIKRVGEVNEPIGDFIHNGFMQYGEQNNVVLNYDEFCFIAEDSEGRIIGAITGRAYYNEVHIGDLIVDEGHRRVTRHKTFEAAIALHKEFPDKKIAVLNFASATRPGGGVKREAERRKKACADVPHCTRHWIAMVIETERVIA